MSKRGNGEGGKPRLRPDGRWEARYWDSREGKRRSVYGATAAEVAVARDKALARVRERLPVPDGRYTVGKLLDEWLQSRHDVERRASTLRDYATVIRLHLKPTLGGVRVKDLTTRHVLDLLTAKRREIPLTVGKGKQVRPRTGKPYSA